MAQSARRTLKNVGDLQTMRSVSSDQLLAMSQDEYHAVRRAATRARLERSPRYVCGQCGHATYAPREGRTGQPYWKHHLGAPEDCPWWTGTPSRVDDVSARQFHGAQESPLHVAMKNTIGELLRKDVRTDAGSVVIDEYLVASDGRRRPDVRAIHNGLRIVIEVQLAATQIPIIVQREDFYDGHAYRLMWVTWNFEPPTAGERMRSSFEDIFVSHNKNLFSMDDETIDLSGQESTFIVRVFWQRDDAWATKLVRLAEMQWLPSGRAFAIAPEPPWHEAFLMRWRAATGEHGTQWPERDGLLDELAARLALPDIGRRELESADTDDLINCLLSLVDGRPVGSRQKNLTELLNTFLGVERRHRFARLIRRFAERCNRGEILAIRSVQGKLDKALATPQDGPEGLTGRIALTLFPDVFGRPPGSDRDRSHP